MQNIRCTNLMTRSNLWVRKIFLSRHTSKVRDKIGLQKIEEKNKQFLKEKIIAKIKDERIHAK